jgi:phage major head subunit gpT-like protein
MILNAATLAILAQAVDMRFAAGLARATTPWDAIAMSVPSSTSENIYPYLKDVGAIREWVGDRVIQNLSKGEFSIKNKTYEQTQGVPRETVEDDTYGVYGPMFENMGLNAASFPADMLFPFLKAGFSTLGPDGQYFFDVDHPVGSGVVSNFMGGSGEAWYIIDDTKVYKPLIWQPRKAFNLVKLFNETDPNVFFQKQFVWGIDGRAGVGYSPFWQLAFASKQTLDATAVEAMLVAMSSQRGESGKPLKITPTKLVCSPTLAETARKIFSKELISGGESNTLFGRLEVISAPELL